MNLLSTSNQDVRPEGPLHSGLSSTAESHAPYFRTTSAERYLLLATILILPLEAHIPAVAGFSSQFLMFAVLAVYVGINRLRCLDRIWMHPVFVAAYLFIGISIVLEFTSPMSNYEPIGRFAFMISGALLVASLCRDRAALKMFLYGYIGAALWLGAFLFLDSYGALSGVAVTNFQDASVVRNHVFTDQAVKGNLNALAFNCTQGAIVAVAFALGSASVRGRNIFAAIGIFCLVASSLPMSRAAIVIALVSGAVLLKAYGFRQGKTWLLLGVLIAGAVFLVPDTVWLRMTVVTDRGEHASKDPRVYYYENALRHVDDYWFTGVGSGNYFQKWGFENGFGKKLSNTYVVYGVHNAFLQVMIFWGLIGLLAYAAVFWRAYRCLPRIYSNDSLVLGILGVAVSTFSVMPFTHSFFYKGLSLGFGVLVAYQLWMAPSNAGPLASR